MIKKFEWFLLVTVISLMIAPVTALAYTDAEILTTISKSVESHSESTKWIMGGVATILTAILGRLFMLIQENRKAFNDEINELNKIMTENCENVNTKIEGHKLYVANNYTKDSKIEHMMHLQMEPMRVEMKGLNDKVDMMQTTLNVIATKLQTQEGK